MPLSQCQKLEEVFLNVDIALHNFFVVAAKNCSSEMIFSCLKKIKNYLLSTNGQEYLNALALLRIKSKLVDAINFKDVIDKFAIINSRKKIF